ncbi:MAG: GNAT family N-acetyltransferase [Oscillospiraceae bacterium]|nr:GNAT family N-acetyltransferase [Oscillospiraceae bacterium]
MRSAGTENIETERLLLRRFCLSDSSDMLKYWVSDEKIQHSYCEPVYKTQEEVCGLLNKYISSYSSNDYYRWAIIERESGRCIGQIAFFLVDCKNHFAEIEYCIGADFQCRGYATEAARAVISFGFERAELHKIQICHRSNNLPSKRVIEKCGFTYEGALRDYFFIDGRYYDRLYYSILCDEYFKNIGEDKT